MIQLNLSNSWYRHLLLMIAWVTLTDGFRESEPSEWQPGWNDPTPSPSFYAVPFFLPLLKNSCRGLRGLNQILQVTLQEESMHVVSCSDSCRSCPFGYIWVFEIGLIQLSIGFSFFGRWSYECGWTDHSHVICCLQYRWLRQSSVVAWFVKSSYGNLALITILCKRFRGSKDLFWLHSWLLKLTGVFDTALWRSIAAIAMKDYVALANGGKPVCFTGVELSCHQSQSHVIGIQ